MIGLQVKSQLWLALKRRLSWAMYGMKKPESHQLLGKNVCRLRVARGLTQEQLVEKADISRTYLQNIEAGQKNPTINVITRLKKALKCSWEELLQDL
ncbi:MAG: helix-turn-helix transcriptional regulator [bacterium]